jgi:hypothetical protein
MTITENEKALMIAIATSEYGDYMTDPTWVNCVWGWQGTRKFPGVMSSLVKKGLAKSNRECCSLTDAGADLVTPFLTDRPKPRAPRA